MTDNGKGPKLYSSQTTKPLLEKNVSGRPTKTTTITTTIQRVNTVSKALPIQSKSFKKEEKKYSSNTNLEVPRGSLLQPHQKLLEKLFLKYYQNNYY